MRTKAGMSGAAADRTTAVAAGAAQLPAVFLLWWVLTSTADPYGRDYGGALGLLCVFVLAPLYLPVLGLLHACVQTLPAAVLADRALRRVPWPWWARHLLGAVLVGGAWAAVCALAWGRPFAATLLAFAALGVVPVLAVSYVRRLRRLQTGPGWGWDLWSVWWRAGVASVGLFVLAFAGALAATAMGLVEEYEPPELSAAQVAGVWRGQDGAELRLLPGGRAELSRMPAEAEFASGEDLAVCDGTGTWTFGGPDESTGRDHVAVRLGSGTGSGCGEETSWAVAGTADAPELFVIFGDPDAGELRVLKQAVEQEAG
ncbi:hypothetical protein OG562_18675 [Streptomyces sp. NBC_01275]|uniref:hypothetical protein n=1 Tax=Streptomyces sp. NBC_01275 TaxID=2903807 RepID=UPI002254D2A9|nr:hypothetical protein [Streptomyces sp. NBC_01275]MCX4762966.1 hypothetical protein [Streptomyces sp. NBC_01275]